MDFVKTALHKELAPYEANWFFIRAAAIARRVYLENRGVGVKTLRTIFGSNQRNGTVSSHRHIADGKIIRYCLKQLGKMGFVDLVITQAEDETGKTVQIATKGKRVTKKGRSEMDKIATQIYRKLYPKA
ncbi:MAG: 40S ribosomal protein S19 [Parasulfuritortus sp.]|nr:40S ribosomal protein S19 [Parasulfuritortus sp.]